MVHVIIFMLEQFIPHLLSFFRKCSTFTTRVTSCIRPTTGSGTFMARYTRSIIKHMDFQREWKRHHAVCRSNKASRSPKDSSGLMHHVTLSYFVQRRPRYNLDQNLICKYLLFVVWHLQHFQVFYLLGSLAMVIITWFDYYYVTLSMLVNGVQDVVYFLI